MVNILGLVFTMIALLMLLFFGMGATTEQINGANISSEDANYNNFQTAQNTTEIVYATGSILPYFFVLAFLCGGLLVLLSVVGR